MQSNYKKNDYNVECQSPQPNSSITQEPINKIKKIAKSISDSNKKLITGYYKSDNIRVNSQGQEETIGKKLIRKYPEQVPIILTSKDFQLEKTKQLVACDWQLGYFMVHIKNINKLRDTETFYLMTNDGIALQPTGIMSNLYSKYKSPEDDCLHLMLIKQNVFG